MSQLPNMTSSQNDVIFSFGNIRFISSKTADREGGKEGDESYRWKQRKRWTIRRKQSKKTWTAVTEPSGSRSTKRNRNYS